VLSLAHIFVVCSNEIGAAVALEGEEVVVLELVCG